MDKPLQQPAIRLIDFIVSSVHMDIKNPSDPELMKSIEVEVGVSTGFNKEDFTHYTVNFDVSINNKIESIKLSVKAMGLFETNSEMDEEFKTSGLVQINSPAIAFPFVRSFINTLTTNAGMQPIILPAFNFSSKAEIQ